MFHLSDVELKKINKFIKKHKKEEIGAIGGQFTYCFTPTSIGVAVVIKDSISGEELNVTDYDSW